MQTKNDDRIYISAIKKHDDRDSLIVRFQNISDTPVTYYAGLSLANVDVKGVYITDLNEKRIEKLSVSDEKTEFCIKPKSLFTLEMVIGNGESE